MDTYGYIWIHMVKSMCIYMIYILFASIYYKMVKPGMHHCKMDTNHHQSGYRRGMSRIPQTPDMTQGWAIGDVLAPFFDVGVPWCSSVPWCSFMFYPFYRGSTVRSHPKQSEAFRSPDSGEQTSGDCHAGEPVPPASATVQKPLFSCMFHGLFR